MTTQNAGEKEQGMSEGLYIVCGNDKQESDDPKWRVVGPGAELILGANGLVEAAKFANAIHSHATAAAARRVRELEDREGILLEALEACRTNDRSAAYEYGEKRKLDEAAPPKGKRWNTPFEISRDAIGEWAKAVFGAVGVQSLKQALAGKERTDGGE